MSSIHNYLPETLKDIIDLKVLNEDLDIELNNIHAMVSGIQTETVIKTASLYGIRKWEKVLGVLPSDNDSLEIRRFRVANILTSKLPYTYRWLVNKLTEIVGTETGYTLNINYRDYTITIILSGLDTYLMLEVEKQLRNAIPANMVLEIGGPSASINDLKVAIGMHYGTKYMIPSAYTI